MSDWNTKVADAIATEHESPDHLRELIKEVLEDKDETINLLRAAIVETTEKLNERADRQEKA